MAVRNFVALGLGMVLGLHALPTQAFYAPTLSKFAPGVSNSQPAFEHMLSSLEDYPHFIQAVAPGEAVRIEVNAAICKLNVIAYSPHSERVIATFPVAVGSPEHESPILRGAVTQIRWNPDWIPPNSYWARNEHYTPPGPKNPLGKVRMNIAADYYIHGTNNEASIGSQVSHGCIRMKLKDVLQLAMGLQELYGLHHDNVDVMHSWIPLTVGLRQSVPVSLIYNPVYIDQSNLVIYPDSYKTQPDLKKIIYDTLLKGNILISQIDEAKIVELAEHASPRRQIIPIDSLFISGTSQRMVEVGREARPSVTWVKDGNAKALVLPN